VWTVVTRARQRVRDERSVRFRSGRTGARAPLRSSALQPIRWARRADECENDQCRIPQNRERGGGPDVNAEDGAADNRDGGVSN